MNRIDNLLFFKSNLDDTLRNQSGQIAAEVDSIPKDQLLATPEDDIVDHIYSSIKIEPIVLHEDSKEMEQHETKIDVSGYREQYVSVDRGPIYVPGVKVVVSIPYTGNPSLWNLKPNRSQSVFPRSDIRQPNRDGIGYLDIVIELPVDEQREKFRQRLDDELKSIRFYLDSQKSQVEMFNSTAPKNILIAIQARKERLKTQDGIADLL